MTFDQWKQRFIGAFEAFAHLKDPDGDYGTAAAEAFEGYAESLDPAVDCYVASAQEAWVEYCVCDADEVEGVAV
jgi:hypothetical protein